MMHIAMIECVGDLAVAAGIVPKGDTPARVVVVSSPLVRMCEAARVSVLERRRRQCGRRYIACMHIPTHHAKHHPIIMEQCADDQFECGRGGSGREGTTDSLGNSLGGRLAMHAHR